jgi:hypothetical protein
VFRKKRLVLSLGTAFAILFSIAVYVHKNYLAPILMYHSVSQKAVSGNRLIVSAFAFERQMNFLKRNHFTVLPLEEFANLIAEKKKLPSRAVSITLDDGFKDNFTVAFPILKKYNFPGLRVLDLPDSLRRSYQFFL